MKLETTSVKRDIWVKASLEQVWKTHIDPKLRKQWDAWNAEIDFRIGGKVFIQHGWGAVTSSVITEIVEYEKLVFSSENGDFQNITTFVPENDGVRVTVEYRMSWGDVDESMKENMAFGTFRFLQNLKSVLEEGKDLRPGFWPTTLGIKHTTYLGNQGTMVLKVHSDSPAKSSGLLAQDVIVDANEQPIRNYEDLEMFLQNSLAGDAVTLGVFRGDQKIHLKYELAAYPRPYKE
ncbi:MAG TPA: SRPBCC domain-containing protein [Sporolactobacillaceae bacterium]|nr:SRPBCC domain-containing protein [Sporolactobacillaceae bacterium]